MLKMKKFLENSHAVENTLYVTDLNNFELANFEFSALGSDERDVDSDCKSQLSSLFGFSKSTLRIGKTKIEKIDKNIPSKNIPSKLGKLDVSIVSENDVLVIIENKIDKESVETALDEAKFYADGLILKKASEIRVVVGFNGQKVRWAVRVDNTYDNSYKWLPFSIGNKEIITFPSKDLVNFIYNYPNIYQIKEDRSEKSKIELVRCINSLKEGYRQLNFIQNNNHNTIDFTIAFISLKSILEKFGGKMPVSNNKWSELSKGSNQALRENIISSVNYICDEQRNKEEELYDGVNLSQSFKPIFESNTSTRKFSFVDLIKNFNTKAQLDSLNAIYNSVSGLPSLHSSKIDLFGETYELLADKKTKSAFGQYFTGRHIIKPLVRLLFENESSVSILGKVNEGNEIRPKKICDPACGTGGFLTESFKYISELISDEKVNLDDFAKGSIYGFDIFPENITKTKINLYLSGDGFSSMQDVNTLELGSEYDNYFDYIVTNPPYGKSGTNIDSSIIKSSRLEVNFLIKIVKMLKKGGKALIVLPDGILEAPTLSQLREWLIKQCTIDKIVGFPIFAFAPYTKEKTYAVFLTKRNLPIESSLVAEQNNESVWFYIIDNDGYVNSDKRFPTKKKNSDGQWMHDELTEWYDADGNYKESLLVETWQKRNQPQEYLQNTYDEFGIQIHGKKYGFISISDIRKEKNIDSKSQSSSLLNILPEKYLRQHELSTISYDNFKKQVSIYEERVKEIFLNFIKDDHKINELEKKSLSVIFDELQTLKKTNIELKNERAYPINKLFNANQGIQITDEELYNSTGDIPVFTGATGVKKGYTNKAIVNECDLPCLSYQTKGNNTFIINIQERLFSANNTAILIPKKEFRSFIVFEYVIPKIALNMAKVLTSAKGVSYIDTRIHDTFIFLPVNSDGDIDVSKKNEVVTEVGKINSVLKKIEFML